MWTSASGCLATAERPQVAPIECHISLFCSDCLSFAVRGYSAYTYKTELVEKGLAKLRIFLFFSAAPSRRRCPLGVPPPLARNAAYRRPLHGGLFPLFPLTPNGVIGAEHGNKELVPIWFLPQLPELLIAFPEAAGGQDDQKGRPLVRMTTNMDNHNNCKDILDK